MLTAAFFSLLNLFFGFSNGPDEAGGIFRYHLMNAIETMNRINMRDPVFHSGKGAEHCRRQRGNRYER